MGDDADELERVHELDGSLAPAPDAERHHPARSGAVKLLFDELAVRGIRQSREIDPGDLFLRLEPFGDFKRAFGMPADADMKRLEAEVDEKRVERRGNGAEITHQVRGALGDVGEFAEGLPVAEPVI